MLLRLKRQFDRENKDLQGSLFGSEMVKDDLEFVHDYADVPLVSGNQIRGVLRRIAMYDFCKLAGIEKIKTSLYHMLFTGGMLDSSTGNEDLSQRERIIAMCPLLGVFGSAIGNQTIEGELKVSAARPQCTEHGTGEKSFWNYIHTEFNTRSDSAKTEQSLELVKDVESGPTQMLFYTECFNKGVVFDQGFVMTSDNPLMVSAFWRAMRIFAEFGYLGGQTSGDKGLVDTSILLAQIPENGDKIYLDYVAKNAETVKAFWEPKDLTDEQKAIIDKITGEIFE
jgi:hypothetical protein